MTSVNITGSSNDTNLVLESPNASITDSGSAGTSTDPAAPAAPVTALSLGVIDTFNQNYDENFMLLPNSLHNGVFEFEAFSPVQFYSLVSFNDASLGLAGGYTTVVNGWLEAAYPAGFLCTGSSKCYFSGAMARCIYGGQGGHNKFTVTLKDDSLQFKSVSTTTGLTEVKDYTLDDSGFAAWNLPTNRRNIDAIYIESFDRYKQNDSVYVKKITVKDLASNVVFKYDPTDKSDLMLTGVSKFSTIVKPGVVDLNTLDLGFVACHFRLSQLNSGNSAIQFKFIGFEGATVNATHTISKIENFDLYDVSGALTTELLQSLNSTLVSSGWAMDISNSFVTVSAPSGSNGLVDNGGWQTLVTLPPSCFNCGLTNIVRSVTNIYGYNGVIVPYCANANIIVTL